MPGLSFTKRVSRIGALLSVALLFCAPLAVHAQVVTTVQDESGWKLQVDGEDFYVKGVVWGYSPRNQNYSYNLWGESDQFIRDVLDYEFGLMSDAGINAIRTFTTIPPRWVEYIYREHGILTVVNPLMGRYGYTIGGQWVPFTDYSDPLTRETLIRDMTAIVEEFKDVEGVLMFAFGNESNYGLSWSSFEIENLPVGEQNTAKARYLYSLWNEVIVAGKEVAPHHQFSIVNGDIQYIDLIEELVTDLDILGVNAYRGPSFTDMWERVDQQLDLPILFFEFGSDAFNARDFKEDQEAQAIILRDQWQEMYEKAAGNGEEGNAIGGFVFEWRDEWWKYLQTENLDIQDTNASWSNQAYMFDWTPDGNNMNEEWFGIMALGTPNADGVYEARPRMAYNVLAQVFSMDPYAWSPSAIEEGFANIDMELYAIEGEVRRLDAEATDRDQFLRFDGGSVIAEMVFKGREEDIRVNGENGVEFSDGQMVFLDFGFTAPIDRFDGQFSINILGNVADKEPLEIQYGRRGLPLVIETTRLVDTGEGDLEFPDTEVVFNDRERVEIYDFSATYEGDIFDLEAFYNTPRYHWKYEGDMYGLLREATDIEGGDIWNAKAPEGVEFTFKGALEGLTFLVGPEVYWGANPKFIIKYDFATGNIGWTFIHSEDVARQGESASATQATERQSRQTTIYAETTLFGQFELQVAGIMSATEKVDDIYTRYDARTGDIIFDQIDFEDTLGMKFRVDFPVLGNRTYIAGDFAGLVADGGDGLREFGTRLPYSGLGNKNEIEAGMMINIGNWLIFPRLLYRDNLVNENPFIEPTAVAPGVLNPGIAPRDRDNDPFAVLGNREARSAELFLTYDPTGATPFYAWDNDWKEDAPLAFNIGLNYTEYPTATDANLFFFEPQARNASFGVGLPAEDVWTASSRVVYNPTQSAKYIFTLIRAFDQSTGDPNGGTRDYWELHGKAVFGGRHIFQGYFKQDAFGPYDFHRQFNVTFPEQFKIDYSFLMDGRRDEMTSTQAGIRALYRSLDENSPGDEFQEGVNDYIFQVVAYIEYRF
ncbi:MAG: hypothetical protein QNI99_12535 [Woeseiaceae bacterium]|nr:hypothetical protein [Woeseiaceae bacterium]